MSSFRNSPARINALLVIPSASSGSVARVQRMILSSGHDARYTIAAGVSGSYPRAINSEHERSIIPAERNNAIDALFCGESVRPSMREIMSV